MLEILLKGELPNELVLVGPYRLVSNSNTIMIEELLYVHYLYHQNRCTGNKLDPSKATGLEP